jgi:hypothetical protein
VKPWYKSKTVIVNALTLIAMILGTVAQWPEMMAYTVHIVYALSIVNVLLRFVTKDQLR